MKIPFLLPFLALSLFSMKAFAFNHGFEYNRQSLAQKQFKSMRVDGSLRIAERLQYDQKLDHGDLFSPTFKQRYFVDSTYAVDGNSPVFYIICGEWNCAGTGSYGFAEGLAKTMKAHLVALEHRYYGESLPMTKLTTQNLKYLNLESAIADLASFQKYMMKDKGLRGKWIAFGGSYAGTLSAFYRLKHPELVAGALASSAPVFIKPEFYEYDAHIAKVIGTSSCGDKVREAVALIEKKMITPEGAKDIKAKFGASDIRNDIDFLYIVADVLAAAVQYGRDQEFCGSLAKNPDAVAGYIEGAVKIFSAMGSTPMSMSMQSAEKLETTPQDNFRQWMWQSCHEFGWFQVSNYKGVTSRSTQVDLKYHEEVCERLYQKPMEASTSMNAEWFAKLFNPKTSKIIFSNGGNDPWLTLSVIPGSSERNPAFDLFMMDGAAHCNDLKAVARLPSVMMAQKNMALIIESWLK